MAGDGPTRNEPEGSALGRDETTADRRANADSTCRMLDRTVPSANEKAPTNTCAVAMSAALSDQIVAAPNTIWVTSSPSQLTVSRVTRCLKPSSRQADQAQHTT